jgi:Tfp pilus assembly protein PilV
MSHTRLFTGAHRSAQRGTSLLESLLAFAVLAAGVLSMSMLQQHMHAHADVARQRSEAVRIAQHDIESMRAFATVHSSADATPAGVAYDRIAAVTASIDQLDGMPLNAVYQLTRQLDSASDSRDAGDPPHLKSTRTRVSWTARDGSAHSAVLDSAIAGSPPAMAGALSVAPGTSIGTAAGARVPGMPPRSIPLRDGRSAFKPHANGSTALVIDHASGWVVARCEVPARIAADELRTEHLSACRDVHALLLSGVVRFSAARPPNAASANDAPLDVAVSVALSAAATGSVSAASPSCQTEAQKTVQYRAADGTHRTAVALDALPAAVGATEWTDLGERFVAYHCLVPVTAEAPHWSGVSTLLPIGWTVGTGSADHRVCRYTATDLDSASAGDRNAGHPAVYSAVHHTLLQQNFLVIAGDQLCPDGAAARMSGDTATQVSTAPHQP